MDRDRECAINMLAYWWEERGDLERWARFNREHLAREFPAVLKAWDDYKTSRLELDAVVRDMKQELL